MALSPRLYIRDGDGNIWPTDDLVEWGYFFRDNELRLIRASEITTFSRHLKLKILTVFLSMDNNLSAYGAPILFKTMALDDGKEIYMEQYETEEAAIIGHDRIVAMLLSRDPEFKECQCEEDIPGMTLEEFQVWSDQVARESKGG